MSDFQPIACTLNATEAQTQLDEWAELRSACLRSEVSGSGAALWFEASAESPLRRVAEKEAACCSFLDLSVVRDGDLVRLDIRSDQAEAQPVIEFLASQASARGCSC